MKRREEIPQDKDRHLDIPSEANQDKHINFLEQDANDTPAEMDIDDETRRRQQEWHEGLEEGKKRNR